MTGVAQHQLVRIFTQAGTLDDPVAETHFEAVLLAPNLDGVRTFGVFPNQSEDFTALAGKPVHH